MAGEDGADHAERADCARALDGLKPRSAEDVALHAHERERVAALVNAGRPIESVIASADRVRLAAILDGLETSDDVFASGQGDAIIAERTAAIFDRLAEVDDAARKIADAEAAAAPGQAWAAVLVDAVEQRVAAKSVLYRADASAYDLVAAAEREVDVAVIDRLLYVLA